MTDDYDIDHGIDHTDALDVLIGDVAKAMTSAPGTTAGDDFARRVSMRIAAAGDRRQSWFRPWVLVPLAAAIVLIVLVRLKPDTTRDGNVRLKPDATAATTADTTVRRQPDATPDTAGDVRLKPDATPDATFAAPAQIVRIEPALAPIEIDPIAIEPLVETNAVQITPIAIDRIEIAEMP